MGARETAAVAALLVLLVEELYRSRIFLSRPGTRFVLFPRCALVYMLSVAESHRILAPPELAAYWPDLHRRDDDGTIATDFADFDSTYLSPPAKRKENENKYFQILSTDLPPTARIVPIGFRIYDTERMRAICFAEFFHKYLANLRGWKWMK